MIRTDKSAFAGVILLKHIKRTIVLALLTLVVLLYVAIVLANNYKAAQLEKRLKDYPIPPDTYVVDSLAIAGKMDGNGNGMQWYGFLLIDSELSKDDLTRWYEEAIHTQDDEWLWIAHQETPYVFQHHKKQFSGFTDNGQLYQVCLSKYSVVGCEESTWEAILNSDIRAH